MNRCAHCGYECPDEELIYKKNIVSIDQKTKEIKIDTRNLLDVPFG